MLWQKLPDKEQSQERSKLKSWGEVLKRDASVHMRQWIVNKTVKWVGRCSGEVDG